MKPTYFQKILIAFALFFSIGSQRNAVSNEQVQPFVTCHLMGQVGNQLFQIATTLAYAWDHHAIAMFPDLHNEAYRLSYNRSRLFFRVDASACPRPLLNGFTEGIWHSSEKIPEQVDQILFGYFQSWRHFDHHHDKILSVFAPSEEILKYLHDKYADLIASPHTVSLHLRTFNRALHHSKIHPFMGLEYYVKAIELFPPETIFVVFSDRIQWCKHQFSQFDGRFVFIEGNDAIQDLFLMSMMKHQVICNSTFSWWAAYLNQNPEKKVVAPKYWMHPDYYLFPPSQPNDFYLPNWIVVEENLNEPYPIDMTWYDVSQSLDGD